jgi:branched-chain amino acid aminotransferase
MLDGAAVDADALAIGWADPAAQWGLGVFETVAVRDGAPRFLDEHAARLKNAAARLGVPLPAPAAVEEAARVVSAGVSGGHGWLKIIASRSGRWAAFGGPSDPSEEGRAVAVIVLPWRRHRLDPLSGIKSLAYASSIVGLEEARRRGADEGLWLNERGHVIEGCMANIFVIAGRAAVTPALSDGARDGVTRGRAIEALRAMGHSVRQSKVRFDTLRSADEVFLTSSLCGVRPVVRIDRRDVRGGSPGPVTRKLAERLSAMPVKEAEDHA